MSVLFQYIYRIVPPSPQFNFRMFLLFPLERNFAVFVPVFKLSFMALSSDLLSDFLANFEEEETVLKIYVLILSNIWYSIHRVRHCSECFVRINFDNSLIPHNSLWDRYSFIFCS